MMTLFSQVTDYLSSGGYVMPPLLLITIVLWYAIGYRYSVIRNSRNKLDVRTLLANYFKNHWHEKKGIIENAIEEGVYIAHSGVKNARPYLDDSFWKYERNMAKYSALIKILVSIAPLLGLLGTVSGMIETFDSLQDMSLFKQDGGIAAGISQALITTQYGLAVAIPALLVNGMIEKRRKNILLELAQLKDILCSQDVTKKMKVPTHEI